MWGLGVHSSLNFSFSRKSFSDDIYIFSSEDHSGHETYYLGSPHLDSIPPQDFETAYYRAKGLVRLLNGCLLLTDDLTLRYDNQIFLFNDNNDVIQTFPYRKNDLQIAEYEEIVDPFDHSLVLQKRAEKSYLRDCLILAKENKLVRQTIIYFVLSKLDVLYFLINTYKIYENILYDLGIPKNEKTYKNKVREKLPDGLRTYLDYFIYGNFSRYANSEKGAGILSRHGEGSHPYDEKKLDIDDIYLNISNLINHWLRVKMQERFGYYYDVEYVPVTDDSLTNEDFNF